MLDPKQRQNWSSVVNMATGDAGKAIKAAPGTGKTLFVTKLIYNVTTSAAQAVDIESVGGATELFKAPASLAVGTYVVLDSDGLGVALPENVGLSAVASAGVGATIFAEGYISHTGV